MMISLTLFKSSAVFVIFVISVVGGIWPFIKIFQHKNLERALEKFDFPPGEFFASGVFLGAGLLHLLPDAAKQFAAAGYTYPIAFLIAACGFLLFLAIEQVSLFLQNNNNVLALSLAIVTTFMLSFHALLEGTAVGVTRDFSTGFVIFLAIITHKGAESFSLALHLRRSALHTVTTLVLFGVFILMTPLGIIMGSWLSEIGNAYALLSAVLSSLAAGTFLYIGTLHGLEHACLIRHRGNLIGFVSLLLGFTLMAVVAVWA